MKCSLEGQKQNMTKKTHRNIVENLTKSFVEQSQEILGDLLVGIYLHGSAVMGCYHEKKSDIDLLVVVNTIVPNEMKRQYMDMIVELNTYAPEKGLEVSIVRKEVCRPFVYPTPFELHFSVMHLPWYKTNPSDYIDKMHGTDKDLAAHVTIIYHRGKCLCGKEIRDVFGRVSKEFYFDSIWNDIKNAEEEIITNPTYVILNLCRVLAYKKDGLILSKWEGGDWGINHVPERYHCLILHALEEYSSDKSVKWNENGMRDFASYMLDRIRK